MTSNAEPTSIRVELADRAYDILIGENLLSNASSYLAPILARPRIVIITDKTVSSLHLAPLRASLDGAGIQNDVIVVSPGETTKNFTQLQGVLNRLLDLRVERKDTILALGGGVVGDLAGFASAILHRGVNFVQVPTTLLAQVDSSVGGKTAINAAQGKNLIGAFYQPKMVLSDVATLDSLPTRELRAGYGEVVKYGLIDDFPFFEWLEEHGSDVLSGNRAALCHAIAVSCRSKAAIVARDEREGGDRALLNLGHTFAHALEAESGYDGRLLHGEAVAIGLHMAFALSSELGLCPRQETDRLQRHLISTGLPATVDQIELKGLTPEIIMQHMRQDKKVTDGRLTFILARGIGRAFIKNNVAEDAVTRMLKTMLQSGTVASTG